MNEGIQRFDPRQVMSRPRFEVFHYHDARPSHVEIHHHDFYEVYYLLAGKVEYRVEGHIYPLEPGEVLLISPQELHQPLVAPEQSYERIVLWVEKSYLEGFADGELGRCFDAALPTHVNVLRPSPARRDALLELLRALVRESYGSEYGGGLYAQGLLLQFLVELNRLSLRAGQRKHAPEEHDPLIAGVVRHIGEHYSEAMSLEELAARFYVSKYHLSHEFSRVMGVSVHRYILLKRLQMARQMLADGAAPGAVCTACGFGDYANFYRAFRSRYGVTPRACTPEGE